MDNKFNTEYLGKFVEEPSCLRELREYAKDYHVACESYDRNVCTGRIGKDGGIMPATNEEFILINNNAIREASIYFGYASEIGYDKKTAQEILVQEV